MTLLPLIVRRISPAARTAVCLVAVAWFTGAGCAEKPAEEAPVDVEQQRQEHMKMMQRETGQAPAPESK
jgi:hypothetical protein